MSEETICKQCGEPFYQWRLNQVFCSNKCSSLWTYNHIGKITRQQKRQIYQKKCRHCGEEIQTTNAMKVYCSNACKVKYLNEHRTEERWELKKCPICGTEFIPGKKSNKNRKYCSAVCRNKAGNDRRVALGTEKSFPKRKNGQWKGNWWKALERDKFTCQLCGKRILPGQKTTNPIYGLVVHHWDVSHDRKLGTGNHSLENLVTLCQKCHNLFHTEVHLVKVNNEFFMKGEIFAKLGITEIKVLPL